MLCQLSYTRSGHRRSNHPGDPTFCETPCAACADESLSSISSIPAARFPGSLFRPGSSLSHNQCIPARHTLWASRISPEPGPTDQRVSVSREHPLMATGTAVVRFGSRSGNRIELVLCQSAVDCYSMISTTRPEPTVLPPSRIANRLPSSIAIGLPSSMSMVTLSPGMHISTPSGRCAAPVTSVVLK